MPVSHNGVRVGSSAQSSPAQRLLQRLTQPFGNGYVPGPFPFFLVLDLNVGSPGGDVFSGGGGVTQAMRIDSPSDLVYRIAVLALAVMLILDLA